MHLEVIFILQFCCDLHNFQFINYITLTPILWNMLPYSRSVIAILGFNVKFFSQFESDFNQVLRISWVRNL